MKKAICIFHLFLLALFPVFLTMPELTTCTQGDSDSYMAASFLNSILVLYCSFVLFFFRKNLHPFKLALGMIGVTNLYSVFFVARYLWIVNIQNFSLCHANSLLNWKRETPLIEDTSFTPGLEHYIFAPLQALLLCIIYFIVLQSLSKRGKAHGSR